MQQGLAEGKINCAGVVVVTPGRNTGRREYMSVAQGQNVLSMRERLTMYKGKIDYV